MLPLQQAFEVKLSILEYLKATFGFKDKGVEQAFDQFLTDPKEGIFKGPYVSLKLPFVTSTSNDQIPLEIAPDFPPYDHQLKSFSRLTTKDSHQPQSTLITTGTSSGKTECFLYPILDHVYKMIGQKGIKVVILYPMNALATDQAKRLAETIWQNPKLKGKVTAGLFIGEGKEKKKFPAEMGEHHIVENRISIVQDPPDILLTNFKMLDYALLRSEFHSLWTYNFENPELLRFLVLDELHTYDGAQGTDVANLIRRLKLKLSIDKGHLCAIGTSATMGSGPDSIQLLTEYASKVFGETFTPDSVITEKRLTADEFFDTSESTLETYIPRPIGLTESRMKEEESYSGYISRQKRLWQLPETLDAVALGKELKKLKLVKDLITITSQSIIDFQELIRVLADQNEDFRRLPEWDPEHELNPREEVIHSILALISEAKMPGHRQFPFLYLQIQLWAKELAGVLRRVGPDPIFVWRDTISRPEDPKALPAYFCRECGASGWLGVKDDNKNKFFDDPDQVYDYYFDNHKNIYFINTQDHPPIDEYSATDHIQDSLHIRDFTLHDKITTASFPIHAVRKTNDKTRAVHVCPECNTENTPSIIGTRVATLSSITVSQILASDLDPRPEKLRKVLVFTNSVQDAAHQSSFIKARNYRFTFRASLQNIINKADGPISLLQLQDNFVSAWKSLSATGTKPDSEAYYYKFLPSDLEGKVDLDHDYRDKTKRLTSYFQREFDLRVHWEITSEFGYNALIGRTLEKSGSSAVSFNTDQLTASFKLLKEWLDHNSLGHIGEQEFLLFLTGMLHRIRIRGGVDHPFMAKFRSGTLHYRELNWTDDQRHFLNPGFSTKGRFPKFIVGIPNLKGVSDSTYTLQNNWFHRYFKKSFPTASSYSALVNEFFQQLLEVLVECKIINKKGNGDHVNYAIDPSALWIENKVITRVCGTCGSKLHVGASDTLSDGAPCQDYTCPGAYTKQMPSNSNYYYQVYNRNLSPRIYSAEHTGLLERRDREIKESDFKERTKHNSLNTMVATSTLEMGIDIGTLNTVINNAVPPLPSNFIQRVGRAGRTSGTALVTTFAKRQAHDLYYYEEPKDMMEGQVTSPGCYLEAREILNRHFLAYCLDSWASHDPVNNRIPGRMLLLRLSKTDLTSPDLFINRIIRFIAGRQDELYDRFTQLYTSDHISPEVFDQIKSHLMQGGFGNDLMRAFINLKLEYETIRHHLDQVQSAIEILPNDEERKNLETDRKLLLGQKRTIDKRSVLEHLTNIGLLPNYAFPETGVTLNAWVRRQVAKSSESTPIDHHFEIIRPGSTALSELAPDNQFYAQGYKFKVSGLNTYDWKNAETLRDLRFCSNCDNTAEAVSANESHCPKCGDISWSSAKNHHYFVKLDSVKSVNDRESAVIDDNSEDREVIGYKKTTHFRFDPKSYQGAWGMKEIPFGIAFIKNVDITVANLGLNTSVHADKITINQLTNVPSHGFVTCRHCGKSTSNIHAITSWHFGYCKKLTHTYQDKEDDVFIHTYLFRKLSTECLKVLIPVQEFESESMINMFKAGLELGLKKYYKGNPQHIQIENYSEFNQKNSRFDKYLILYDTIPGGTGYLEKLFDPKEFTLVLRLAYEAIRDCSCQLSGKDGCYRCIYTYTNQRIQHELSRNKAEKIFRRIVERSNQWESIGSGLGTLTDNGQIEESELELRFIGSLRKWLDLPEMSGSRLEEFLENGITNYKIRIEQPDNVLHYTIRPQVELGQEQGIEFATRPDFVISLTAIEKLDDSQGGSDWIDHFKKIAVYLDGYTYHATEENLRVYDDIKKRIAIAASDEYISWTLTWNDLERFDALLEELSIGQNHPEADHLAIIPPAYKETIDRIKKTPIWLDYNSALIKSKNSFDRLIWVLTNPMETQKRLKQIALFLLLRQTQFGVPSMDAELLEKLDKVEVSRENVASMEARKLGNFYVFPELPDTSTFTKLHLGIKIKDLTLRFSMELKHQDQSLERNSWEGFWQTFNLIQYLL